MISQPTKRAVDRLTAGLRVAFNHLGRHPSRIFLHLPAVPAQCRDLASALHDLLVCVLVDFENERRAQTPATGLPGHGWDAVDMALAAEALCDDVDNGSQPLDTDQVRLRIAAWRQSRG